MGDYNGYSRNVLNTPHPVYGLPEGFGVGDLPNAYQAGLPVFTAITTNTTSGLIPIDANSVELVATFSDLHTSCSISVYLADGITLITTFNGVSTLNSSGLFIGFADQRVLLGGGSLIFKTTNYSGTGTLTLNVRRTG